MYADQTDERFFRYRRAAERASRDARIQGLALDLAGVDNMRRDPATELPYRAQRLEQARRLLRGVQKRVRYVDAPQEFSPPVATWARGAGDCKSQASLLAALALAAGCDARLVSMGFRGDPSHCSVQLAPFGGSPWLWAEPSILGARLGEHPSHALARLGGARRSDLGACSGDRAVRAAGAAAGIHAQAAEVIRQAFQKELGRAPALFERQVVQAICYGETSYGRGWKAPCDTSHNWGAVHAKDGQPGCDYSDSTPDGTRYHQDMRAYPDDVSGAADVVKLLYKNMADVGRILARAGGIDAVSAAMFYDHYYGAACPNAIQTYGDAAKQSYAFPAYGKRATTTAGKACERECIAMHQAALSRNAFLIADALGEPRPSRGGGVLSFVRSPAFLIVGGVALAGAGVYLGRGGGRASRAISYAIDEVIP